MGAPPVTIRALARIDRMQPQYAAYWGLMAQGALPLAGMTQLLIEVSPSNAVFPLTDVAMKSCDVRSAGTLIERDFGLMELHAPRPDPIVEAERVILASLGLARRDRLGPELVSTQRVSSVTGYQSQLVNKVRRGAWTLPGDTLAIVELTPAAYAYAIADEIVKQVDVDLVRCAGTGLYGRLIVAGTESAAEEAERVAHAVIEEIRAVATIAARAGG